MRGKEGVWRGSERTLIDSIDSSERPDSLRSPVVQSDQDKVASGASLSRGAPCSLEVFQNCNIFNDGAYAPLTDKDVKLDNVIVLEHGQPMVFGKEKNKGIKLDGFSPVVVDLNDGKHSINDLWVHDEKDENPIRAFILAHLTDSTDLPTPIGVFRQVIKETYDDGVENQIKAVTQKKGKGTLHQLLYNANTWEVE